MGLNFEAKVAALPRLARVLFDVNVKPPRGAGTDSTQWFTASDALTLLLDLERMRVTMVARDETKHVSYMHVVDYVEADEQPAGDKEPAPPPEPTARVLDDGEIALGNVAIVRGKRGRRG